MMPDATYVPLHRIFGEVDEEPSTGLSRRMFGAPVGGTWDKLVPIEPPPRERSALIVLSPSGAGKTTELDARANGLREAGVAAFCARATDVALSGAIDAVANADELRAWLASASRAVFFIDAVDEARLEGHDLERVLRRFAHDIDPATKSVQLVLSSRNDVWSADDVRHVVRELALPAEEPPVRMVRLEPLSEEDLRCFAAARGIDDTKAFIDAVRADELEQLFDWRPPDAELLVEYWKQNARFGSWSEMLTAFIEASVRNENKRHALQQQFTSEEARSALGRLGAATVFGKRPIIAISGDRRQLKVSAERLFADRQPAFTSKLLAMGIFSQKGSDSVQLPQGAPSHFLAASWLSERAKRGLDPREIERALLIDPFGSGHTRVPRSRSPVLGWVAGRMPSLRKRLLKELPHVVLFEGDPSALSTGECIEALQGVLAAIRQGQDEPNPTLGTLRQISKHGIAEDIARLLVEFADVPRAQHLLLRIAEAGRYGAVASPALAIALSPGVETEAGRAAIRLVAATGTSEQRLQLLALCQCSDASIRLELVQSLVPATLNGPQLVTLVATTKISEFNDTFLLGEALTNATLEDIDAILYALTPSLSPVTEAAEAHLSIVLRLAVARLARDSEHVPAWFLGVLLAIEELLGLRYVGASTVDSLNAMLGTNATLRRALWEARIAVAEDNESKYSRMVPRLGPVQDEDLEWFWKRRRDETDEALRDILSKPIDDALRRMTGSERSAYVQRANVTPELKEHVSFVESEEARTDALRRASEAKRVAEKAALRDENISHIQVFREDIEAGRNGWALAWAWPHLTDGGNKQGRIGTGQLAEQVGEDLANAFMVGFQKWWRQYEPPLRQPGDNSVPGEALAGLTGLSLEIANGLKLATLSDADVDRAVRYALHELNGFPGWFDDLRQAHPVRVTSVLRQVISGEWGATVAHHGVISRAPYEAAGTAELLRELVIDELERGAPGHPVTLHSAISALLPPTRASRNVTTVLERHVTDCAGHDAPVRVEWLRGWSHFAPEDAAKWLQKLAESDEATFLNITEQLAAMLEEDFDERTRPVAPASWTPEALEAWVRILLTAVRPEDDIHRANGRVYSPNSRDDAQDFRRRCVNLIARNPSQAAYEALRRLRAVEEMLPYADEIDGIISFQLDEAAESLATPWSENDILAFEKGDERPPKTNADLFALVLHHVTQVAGLLENADFSYASLFDEDQPEKEVQCWIASSLELISRRLYSVERESEVQDDKKMDISITVPGVGRIPIEIKPVYGERPSLSALKEFVSSQLIGRYMRPADVERGIFLLVPLKNRRWNEGGRRLTLDEVRSELQEFANQVGAKADKRVTVMCIDIAKARSKAVGKVRQGDRHQGPNNAIKPHTDAPAAEAVLATAPTKASGARKAASTQHRARSTSTKSKRRR
jgi:hypothetical protein